MRSFWNMLQDKEASPQGFWDRGDFLRQQDASEYLSIILAILRAQLETASSPAIGKQRYGLAAILTTVLTNARRCPDCLYHPNAARYSMNEELDIVNVPIDADLQRRRRGTVSLEELLPLAFDPTTEEPKNCSGCYDEFGGFDEEGRKDWLWRKIAALPEVLFMGLNRFRRIIEAETTVKIDNRVVIPEEIDLKRFCEKELQSESTRYRLTGVISHAGNTPNSGHYNAYVKIEGKWWLINDDSVSPACFENIDAADNRFQPYLMTWERVVEEESELQPQQAAPMSPILDEVEAEAPQARLHITLKLDGRDYGIDAALAAFNQALYSTISRRRKPGTTWEGRIELPENGNRRRKRRMIRLESAMKRGYLLPEDLKEPMGVVRRSSRLQSKQRK